MEKATRRVSRKSSSKLETQRDEVRELVAQEARTRLSRLSRKGSAYLPTHDVKLATGAIQAVYALHQRYERRRHVDNAAFVIAMIGVALVFIDNEYVSTAAAKQTVRVLNAALTGVLLLLVVWRYALHHDILVRRNAVPPHVSPWRMPRQLLSLLLELAVCALCVPPGVNGTFELWEWKYDVNDDELTARPCAAPFTHADGSCYLMYEYPYEVLGLLTLLRLYMLPRVILNLSDFTNYRTSYLGTLHHVDTQSPVFAAKCFLRAHPFQSPVFAAKCFLRAHPFQVLAVAFLATLVLSSYALAILEAPVNPSLAPLWNAAWLVVLTMGTIGYGDLTATTLGGQVVLIVGGMVAGILLFGVLSAAIFSYVALEDDDRRFLALLKRQAYNQRLRDAICERRLYRAVSKQREVRKQHVEDFHSLELELQRAQSKLIDGLRADHEATIVRLAAVEARLDALLVDAMTAASA
ncbi:hypothetical protein P43SY_003129 [Pythium insidiosum]|uniref:Potassium channel domain-containing protein n=1 Tax=Pythium insidiosum TaxID=114742 RepID=A0AAD5MHV5_PYTIN|nr:hypothetical protein P43SY_003129 [Pythium insidiosum]